MKGAKAGPLAAATSPPSIAETNITDEDGKSFAGTSVSLQSDSGVHASQVSIPGPASTESAQDAPAQSRKTKRQLWDELTISCEFSIVTMGSEPMVKTSLLTTYSYYSVLHISIHPRTPHRSHSDTAQPPRSALLPLFGRHPRHELGITDYLAREQRRYHARAGLQCRLRG